MALSPEYSIISVLAVLGTGISTVVVGFGMHYFLGLPILIAMLFGTIISPTDPISVLAIFKRLGVNERLTMIVEAESLFNDGIAVVLFGVIQSVIMTNAFSLSQSIYTFVVIVCGGTLIGILIGAIASRITKEFDDHLLEITLTTVVAYGSYLAAESVHVSGVIAVVAASLVMGNYGLPKGMTPASRMAVISFWEYAAFAVNSMVFLLVGLEIAVIPITASLTAVFIVVGIVLLGRAMSVYSLSTLLSAFGQLIPAKWQHLLVWSGLRGALSMAMVLGISTKVSERNILISLIFGVVLFSLVGQGLTIKPLVSRLGLSRKKGDLTEYQLLLGENVSLRMAMEELDNNVKQGVISQSTHKQISQRLARRKQEIEQDIDKLHMSNENISAVEMKKAERIVLLAQKTALQSASRSGVMELNVAANLIGKLEEEQARREERFPDA